jgi:translation elongation factor EF-Ts
MLTLIRLVQEETKASHDMCRQALEESGNDLDKAVKLIYATRTTKRGLKNGRVYAAVFGEVAVVLELSCKKAETTLTVDFGLLLHDLAYQIAVRNPVVISFTAIPVVDPLSSIPPPSPEDTASLLSQNSIIPDHSGKTVKQVIQGLEHKYRDTVVIKRFTRYTVS